MDVDYPEDLDFDNPKVFGQAEFLYYGDNDGKSFVFWSTIPFMLFGLMIGILVFIWARQLYGYNAGLFALTLFSFSPVMLAYSWTIIPDLILTGLMLLSLYCFWIFYNNAKPLMLVLCAVFFGLALATKPTSVFLLIIFLFVGLIGIYRKDFIRPLDKYVKRYNLIALALVLAIILLICIAVFVGIYLNEIHPIYTDNDSMYKNAGYARSDERLDILIDKLPVTGDFGRSAVSYLITEFPVPAPHFIQGLYSTNTIITAGKEALFMSEYYQGTKLKLYLLIFMLKNSIPFLILLFLAVALLKWNMPEDRMSLYLILAAILIYPLSFLFSKVYGGLTYLLPLYPLMFIFMGNLVNYKQFKAKLFKLVFVILIVSYILISVFAFPNYKSYFNSFLGGSENGYMISIEDTDYYQDLYRLNDYVKENNLHGLKVNYSSYSKFLQYQGIDYLPLEGNKPQTGIIAVDARALIGNTQSQHEDFAWLRKLQPIDRIGDTVFIYNVTEQDLSGF